MPEVKFPLYRSYTATRQEANNAMMALLAGSRLAEHTLQLTVGSRRLLPEMFPAVHHIKKFNLTTEMARELLLDADSHLGAVAVPYALAVHEDFVISTLAMVKKAGLAYGTGGKGVKAYNMHTIFFGAVGAAEPATEMRQFHLLRHMRNTQIHTGGAVSSSLMKAINTIPQKEQAEWEVLTGRAPSDIIQQGKLRFVSGDIIASFAVTKRLGRLMNTALQGALSADTWAEIIVADFAQQTNQYRNGDQWMRRLWGYARIYYGSLQLDNKVLESAAIRLGFWTRAPGSVLPPRTQRGK
jgi:hypothetical protein